MTHYDILGVSFEATEEEIRKAYRKKIFDLHPDRNQATAHSDEAIRWVRAAYETLSDPEKRAEYDLGLRIPDDSDVTSTRLNYLSAVIVYGREQLGLLVFLILSPIGRFPLSATLYLLGLFVLGHAIMPLLPQSLPGRAFERRAFLLSTLFLLFWIIFNPLSGEPREDLLFSMAFGQLLANVMTLIAYRMREEQGLNIRFMPFLVGLITNLMVTLQFAAFLGKNGEAELVGSDGNDWGALFILVLISTATSGLMAKESGLGRSDHQGKGGLPVRL